MFVAEILEESITSAVAVQDSEDYDSGVSAKFMPLNERWGFKMYNNLIEAYFTYFVQRLCASVGISPALGQQMPPVQTPFNEDKFKGGYPWGLGYGYIVERVTLLPKPSWQVSEEQYDEFHNACHDLKSQFEDLMGWELGDCHAENLGWIESAEGVNQWYIIDCGDGMVDHKWGDVEDAIELLKERGLWRGDDVEFGVWGIPVPTADFPSKYGKRK